MKTLLLIAITAATTPLFASADLKITASTSQTVIRAGYTYSGLSFIVRNDGPDVARNVTMTVTAPFEVACPCSLGNIPAGQTSSRLIQLLPPGPAGPITVTASVTSDTPDPNPSDNSFSQEMTVSTDPDLSISVQAPPRQDLGVPFTMSIFVENYSVSDAHDVDITLGFRPDTEVLSLPAGCSSIVPGRIVCHLDVIAAEPPFTLGPRFTMQLVAPAAYGSGSIDVTANATEREHDLDPASNTSTRQILLYQTFYVTTMADAGTGSLRQAILDANANCNESAPCAIGFRIAEPSATPWKTIRPTSPLPRVTAYGVRIDGGIQTALFGDANAEGPEIEIDGGGTVDGDGLLIATCKAEVANLAIGGFVRNGISVTAPVPSACAKVNYTTELHDLFIGTDPTGTAARPNARGIGTSVPNGDNFSTAGVPTNITRCLISGNLHSGIFGLGGRLNVKGNRIGVKAHADEPLPNGNSGVFIGATGYGSAVGTDSLDQPETKTGNVIAFNGEMGVAIAKGVNDVSVRNNRIWGNRLLGIDIGLDGPTESTSSGFGEILTAPVLTLAHYDPVSKKTIIEGDLASATDAYNFRIDVYANQDVDPSGYGEGQSPLGSLVVTRSQPHFHFEADGDLTGMRVTATNTRLHYIGFAKPEGIDQGFLTQTSEFSRWLEVR
jgi:hypothetical protein